MPEPLSPAAVEQLLADVSAHLAWPSLPDSVAAARNRLAAGERSSAWLAVRYRSWLRPVLALLVALLVAVAVLVSVPGTRQALADLFGLGGVTIRQVATTVPASSTAAPPTTVPLDLGEPTTLTAAVEAMPFTVFVPSTLGEPDEVALDTVDDRPVLSLVYRPRPGLPATTVPGVGLLVTEFGGRINTMFEKIVHSNQAQRVTVGGWPAIWIEGPHEIFYVDGGEVVHSSGRLADSTLLLTNGGTTIRLEGAFDQATAIALAEGLVPAA
jgi:hypothetical protein